MLNERTEGWIAGLQLAALRLTGERNRPADPAGFVRSFSGTQRYILDYLVEEVIDRQPPVVQQFLLLTAPLPRLCGPLCDAVLQAAGVASDAREQRSSAAILAALERTNAFLVPLDDDRQWYRYHHLFADLLRARLRESYPGLEPRLQTAAAAWLERAWLDRRGGECGAGCRRPAFGCTPGGREHYRHAGAR
jgi:LuxR family maltose regulon positive regulatory protein